MASTWGFPGDGMKQDAHPRSHSELGHAKKPRTPSSAMWESLGLSIRPSQISLLKSPPNEVREYTIAPTKQMHLHRYCKSKGDGHRGYTDDSSKKGSGKGEGGAVGHREHQAWKGAAYFVGLLECMVPKESERTAPQSQSGEGSSPKRLSSETASPTAGSKPSMENFSRRGSQMNLLMDKIGGSSHVATEEMIAGEDGADGTEQGGFARRGSMGGKRGSFIVKVKQMGSGHIQGMEFVRTLTRKNKPAIESVNPTIGNPYAKHSREYRDEFCALIMGRRGEGAGADQFGPCRQALERDPHDRSMMDLEAILDFARRCSLLMSECTPVERFVALRCARLLRLKAGTTVGTSEARLFIAISGSVVGQRFGREVQYSSGDAFGRKTILNAVRKAGEAKRPCTSEGMGFTPGDEGPGGQLSCRTDVHLLYIDDYDFQRTWESYTSTVAAGQKSDTYIQTFLASIDLFRTWAWSDVLDFAGEAEGMQVDRGVTLFFEGDTVDGVHVLQFGECRMERMCVQEKHTHAKYGLGTSLSAGDDGLPKLSITRSHGPRFVTLGVCGPRTVFGEELAHEYRGAPGASLVSKPAVLPEGVEAKRGYKVTCTTDSWFLFFSRKVWKEMMGDKFDKRRHDRAMRSIEALRLIGHNRATFLKDRVESDEKIEDVAVTKLPSLNKRGMMRWSL